MLTKIHSPLLDSQKLPSWATSRVCSLRWSPTDGSPSLIARTGQVAFLEVPSQRLASRRKITDILDP